MYFSITLLQLFIMQQIIFTMVQSKMSGCVWYGHCGEGPDNYPLNCPYEGPPRIVDKADLLPVLKACPILIDPMAGKAAVCCSDDQLADLFTNFRYLSYLLSPCPACWYNVINFYCKLVCGPNQSNYMVTENIIHNDELKVGSVSVYISERLVERIFESCRDVNSWHLGKRILDVLCGPWGYQHCTAQRWFQYMGDLENGVTPFPINMTFGHGPINGFRPLNMPTYLCENRIRHFEDACSCLDCPAACMVNKKLEM